jgi:hypothetical protein
MNDRLLQLCRRADSSSGSAYGYLILVVAVTKSWGNVEAQGRNLYLFATLTQSWFLIGAVDARTTHLFLGKKHTWSIRTEFFSIPRSPARDLGFRARQNRGPPSCSMGNFLGVVDLVRGQVAL